eukprot:gene7325-11644_t
MNTKRKTELCCILGIETTATQEEIKKTYYKLAREYHPDLNPENKEEATKKFQEISDAYEILSNDKQQDFDEDDDFNFPFEFGGGGGFNDFIKMMFFQEMMKQKMGHGFFDDDDDDFGFGGFGGFGGGGFHHHQHFYDDYDDDYYYEDENVLKIKTPNLSAVSFDITWKTGYHHYRVYLECEINDEEELVYEGKETSCSIKETKPDTGYYIRVEAFDKMNDLVEEDEIHVHTHQLKKKKFKNLTEEEKIERFKEIEKKQKEEKEKRNAEKRAKVEKLEKEKLKKQKEKEINLCAKYVENETIPKMS